MRNIIQIEINLMQSFVFFIFITLPWLLISSLYSPVILAQISVQDWEQKQVSQHILVSSSTVNNVYKVNAKMYVHATPDEFFALLEHTQKDCSWIANCKRVEVLNQSLSQYRFVHTVFNSPWPVADREMYTRSFHQFMAAATTRFSLFRDSCRFLCFELNRRLLLNPFQRRDALVTSPRVDTLVGRGNTSQ